MAESAVIPTGFGRVSVVALFQSWVFVIAMSQGGAIRLTPLRSALG